MYNGKMSFQQRYPVVLLSCGSFNPVTVGHIKMFEIARSFLERTGNHIVIGGVLSPVHDLYCKTGLISSAHRVAMCKAAIKKHAWLSVDTWECSQKDWVTTIKVLQHVANKIKNDYGVSSPYSHPIYYTPARYPRNTVTLQPNGKMANVLLNNNVPDERSSVMCSTSKSSNEAGFELNEASEPDKTGIVLNRLSSNLKKVCCVRPAPLALSDNMVYGATYDLRRTRVMLLCGSDILESFGIPGLWSDDDIQEIVSQYGIVCIPRSIERSKDEDGQLMRDALDRLQKILSQVQGTVLLVNDQRRMEIADVSSTKCRAAIEMGELDNARRCMHPDVVRYACERGLYGASANLVS